MFDLSIFMTLQNPKNEHERVAHLLDNHLRKINDDNYLFFNKTEEKASPLQNAENTMYSYMISLIGITET